MAVVEQVSVGYGGWLRYESSDLPVLFVRMVDRDGRLKIDELYLASTDDRGVRPAALRRLPLGQIEKWVNGDDDFCTQVRKKMMLPGPDLKRLAAHFATTFGRGRDANHWVRDSMWAQIEGSGVRQARAVSLTDPPVRAPRPTARDLELTMPAGKPYPDSFYKNVAQRYGLASAGRNPAGVIADANHVPVTTVHRWVKVARDKDYLPPGQRGKES